MRKVPGTHDTQKIHSVSAGSCPPLCSGRLACPDQELGCKCRESSALARQPHEPTHELSPYVSDLADQTLPLVGREQELARLIELLCHFTRKNPVLVGEPGVGKRTIVGGLCRCMTDGNVPNSLAKKAICALDLPTLRVLEKDGLWHEKLDRALVAAADEGKIFFVNRLHDRRGEISPAASIHVTELLQRAILGGKIQCIGTSTPATFTRLQADGHWLAQYFEPIEVKPADEETAIKVMHGIKGVYEAFHNVSYTGHALEHAVLCASRYMKRGCLPGTAVDVLDETGAAAQLQQGSLPQEVVEMQKRIKLIVHHIENARSATI
jgi:ATP-dependent Clp protease ATP-binding subunit ClpC